MSAADANVLALTQALIHHAAGSWCGGFCRTSAALMRAMGGASGQHMFGSWAGFLAPHAFGSMARSPLSVTGSATSGYGNDADTTDQGASPVPRT